MERVPDQDLRAASKMSAFFIVPPGVKSAVATIFMDHPPLEKRLEALQKLEAQLQSGGAAAIAA
jgi:heat shock protein HtpX